MSCFKSCVLLASIPYKIPKEFLTRPPDVESDTDFMKLGFLKDSFKMCLYKSTESTFCTEIYRIWKNPNEEHDDGYTLRFWSTLTGSDEGTKVAFMDHTSNMTTTTFKLSEETLTKAKSPYYYFDLFLVVQMLEYRSLDVYDEDYDKVCYDGYMSNLKSMITTKDVNDLGYILESTGLVDTFTGRLPYAHMRYVFLIISEMSRDFSKYATFLKDKSEDVESDADTRGLLFFLGRISKERPLSQRSLIELYIKAHKLGLKFFKTITSDYMVKMRDKDCNFILDILGMALLVQDQDLIEEAIIPFLSNFHEIIRSEKFEEYSKYKGPLLRFIMHTARIHVTKNDMFVPGWKMPTQPTTEL